MDTWTHGAVQASALYSCSYRVQAVSASAVRKSFGVAMPAGRAAHHARIRSSGQSDAGVTSLLVLVTTVN